MTSVTITLDVPIARGETEISEIVLRKPGAGELRGMTLLDLGQMNVDAVSKLLPRISTPTLTAGDIAKMDVADLMSCAAEVAGFLLNRAARTDFLDR